LLSLAFDSLFIVQHYVLYPTTNEPPWRQSWNQGVDDLLPCACLAGLRAAMKFSLPPPDCEQPL